MYSSFRRVMSFVGLAWIFTGAVFVSIGCGSLSVFGPFNPFLAARFNTTLAGVVSQGNLTSPADPGTGTGGTTTVVTDITQLSVAQRTIQVSIQNESEQRVRFAMTFVVSAGAGGFVPDSEIQNYLNAGYSDAAPPGAGGSTIVGCDTIGLARGTRLLTLAFGINQGDVATLAGNVTGGTGGGGTVPTFILQRRDNGSANIPLPELIVFGSSDPDFICSGGALIGNLCTQRGFVYSSVADLPVGKPVEASRIQGTVCETNFGTAPEWRLDLTVDNQVQPFQYGRGGTIVVQVLDRSADDPTETRNQVVWTVTDSNDATLHFPDQ
jgi:hypothetical protein